MFTEDIKVFKVSANGTYFTIPAAITAAAANPGGVVVIPPDYKGTESFTNASNVNILDLRIGSANVGWQIPNLTGTVMAAPGAIGGTTPAAGTFTTLTGTTSVTTAKVNVSGACAAVGSGANPSIAACGASTAGLFSCATAATGGTCQVNTTAVTANSLIFVQEMDTATVGTTLGVTCNTSTTVIPTHLFLASSVAGASFTINLGTITTNPACFGFFLVN